MNLPQNIVGEGPFSGLYCENAAPDFAASAESVESPPAAPTKFCAGSKLAAINIILKRTIP